MHVQNVCKLHLGIDGSNVAVLLFYVLPQEMFVDSVLGSGLLLYLPTTWLHKLYHHVLDTPLMGIANLDTSQSPLVCLLDGKFDSILLAF